jgi:REP element-mobilizing transposase RayT
VIEALEETRRRLNLTLGAYAIMPEHVHVLLHPREPDHAMRRILVQLKRPGRDAARRHLEASGNRTWLRRLTVVYPSRRVFRFWQPGGGFDHNIFREETLAAVIEYIHANPVRRGCAGILTSGAGRALPGPQSPGPVPLACGTLLASISDISRRVNEAGKPKQRACPPAIRTLSEGLVGRNGRLALVGGARDPGIC